MFEPIFSSTQYQSSSSLILNGTTSIRPLVNVKLVPYFCRPIIHEQGFKILLSVNWDSMQVGRANVPQLLFSEFFFLLFSTPLSGYSKLSILEGKKFVHVDIRVLESESDPKLKPTDGESVWQYRACLWFTAKITTDTEFSQDLGFSNPKWEKSILWVPRNP